MDTQKRESVKQEQLRKEMNPCAHKLETLAGHLGNMADSDFESLCSFASHINGYAQTEHEDA